MTEQEVRQFFLRLKWKRALRRSLIAEQERVTADMCQIRAVDYEKPHVSGGNGTDIGKMLEAAEVKNQTRAKRIARLTLEIEEASGVALDMISSCDTDIQKSVLMDRHLQGMSWELMEKVHHYSRQHLWRFEQEGISAIARSSMK